MAIFGGLLDKNMLLGVVEGVAESSQQGLEDILNRIDKRIDGADQYHQARAGREEKDHDDMAKEAEKGIRLLHGFLAQEDNSWEKAGMIYNQYGGTLAGAQEAAKAGRLGLAKVHEDNPDKAFAFSSFFDFAQGAFDPENPLTLDDVVNKHAGEFSYTPNEVVNLKPTTGMGKFLFGDVAERINKQVLENLQSKGFNTDEPQPIESVLPSLFTKQGEKYMNLVSLANANKEAANIANIEARTGYVGLQGDLLDKQIEHFSEESQAKVRQMSSGADLNGARAADLNARILLDGKFALREREAAIKLQWAQIQGRGNWAPNDYEAFDARNLAELQFAKKELADARTANASMDKINELKENVATWEAARLAYINDPAISATMKEDIFSKTSVTSIWKATLSSELMNSEIQGVELGLEGQLLKFKSGDTFKVKLAQQKALASFKASYGGIGKADSFIGSIEQNVNKAVSDEVDKLLSPIYEKPDGTFNEKLDNVGSNNVKPYVSNRYGTSNKTVPSSELVLGDVYKIPMTIVKQEMYRRLPTVGNDYGQVTQEQYDQAKTRADATLMAFTESKYYNAKEQAIYGIWGGGAKERFNWKFSNIRKPARTSKRIP